MNKKENDILAIINSSNFLLDQLSKKLNSTSTNISAASQKIKRKIKKKDKMIFRINNTGYTNNKGRIYSKAFKNKERKNYKEKKYENSLNFYNTLSLVMLAILTGGLVGVIFILYSSSKSEEE